MSRAAVTRLLVVVGGVAVFGAGDSEARAGDDRVTKLELVRAQFWILDRPVFGADSVEARDREGRTVFRATPPPVNRSGSFRLNAEEARGAALRLVGEGNNATSELAGWAPAAGALHASWRVDVAARSGSWRILVDAETGGVLFGWNRRREAATAWAYEVSPAESVQRSCPVEGDVRSACMSPSPWRAEDLVDPTSLSGPRVIAVLGCNGADPPPLPGGGPCFSSARAEADGEFRPVAVPEGTDVSDAFAEVNAYVGLDSSSRYLSSLAPEGRPPPPVTAYVNAFLGAQPFGNAFYDPMTRSVTFGQGAAADFAYDGGVITHELVHAWSDLLGGLDPYLDGRGTVLDPLSLDEGIADALAMSRIGRPEIGAYAAREVSRVSLRDARGVRTCGGRGQLGTVAGFDSVDGLVGEPHSDGQIWTSFFWALEEGLSNREGCGGACTAAAELQAKALQMLAGTVGVTFRRASEALAAAARAQYPDEPQVAEFVHCLAQRHLAGCDARTVSLHEGEHKVVVTPPTPGAAPASLQVSLTVVGAAGHLEACAITPSPGRLFLRRDRPVAMVPTSASLPLYQLNSDRVLTVAADCRSARDSADLEGPGTWYALFVASGKTSPAWAAIQLAAGSGIADRAPSPAAATCVLGSQPARPKGGCGHPGQLGSVVFVIAWLIPARTCRRRSEHPVRTTAASARGQGRLEARSARPE